MEVDHDHEIEHEDHELEPEGEQSTPEQVVTPDEQVTGQLRATEQSHHLEMESEQSYENMIGSEFDGEGHLNKVEGERHQYKVTPQQQVNEEDQTNIQHSS